MSKCEPDKHCYHYTGVTLLSYPPLHQKQCCYCGDIITERAAVPKLEGHGPFVQNNRVGL